MTCDVKHCKRSSIVGYAAFLNSAKEVSICDHHWTKHCDDADNFDIRSHFFPKTVVSKQNYFKNLRSS